MKGLKSNTYSRKFIDCLLAIALSFYVFGFSGYNASYDLSINNTPQTELELTENLYSNSDLYTYAQNCSIPNVDKLLNKSTPLYLRTLRSYGQTSTTAYKTAQADYLNVKESLVSFLTLCSLPRSTGEGHLRSTLIG